MNSSVSRSTSLILSLSFFSLACTSSRAIENGGTQTGPAAASAQSPLNYVVDLNDRADDTFKVTLMVNDLGPENSVYQFASTAPGTYQVMDVGRFVRSFEAIDASGNTIPSENISTNQWRISDPEHVVEIRYSVAESWDTPVDENPIYMMAGTSIEDDHVLINGQAVFGYPTGMQARALRIRLEYPVSWNVGTALETDETGAFLAGDYDQVVDSPILLGRLSEATLNVRGTSIDVFTYSKTDKVHSTEILKAITSILNAAGDFLITLPVDRYTFLFHFEDVSMGAWEHSYSSEYVFSESDFKRTIDKTIPDVVAHEFFHVITPLNIHSEIIEYFNFVEPVASEHIWLYEGTTEWVSDIMQLRSGLIDLDEYLVRLSRKMRNNDRFDGDYSLSQLSLNSYSEKGQRQWGNIYERGALVAGLIDLRILELSGGKRGMREVLIDLSNRYGPDSAFVEKEFFDTFTDMTYPEIRTLIDDHIRGTKPLPMAEYYARIGIQYFPELKSGQQIASLDLQVGVEGEKIMIVRTGEIASNCGMQKGDELLNFNDLAVSLKTAQQAFQELQKLGADEPFTMTVKRGEEVHEFTCAKRLVERVDRHVFKVDPNATPGQIALRRAWMTNL